MIGGATRRSRIDATEAQRLKINLIDKDIDNAYRVVLANVIVQTLGQQCKLASVLAFDKSLHRPPRLNGLAYFNWHQPSSEAFRSEEHTSELQSLMRNSYAVFCLNKKNKIRKSNNTELK